jgi:hypothetical protein
MYRVYGFLSSDTCRPVCARVQFARKLVKTVDHYDGDKFFTNVGRP